MKKTIEFRFEIGDEIWIAEQVCDKCHGNPSLMIIGSCNQEMDVLCANCCKGYPETFYYAPRKIKCGGQHFINDSWGMYDNKIMYGESDGDYGEIWYADHKCFATEQECDEACIEMNKTEVVRSC
jgi:hypothetical protein